jgi:hypothetical protein
MKGSVEKAKKKHDVVVPGEFLGSAEEYKSGEGTYVRFCQVYANRSGFKVVEKPNENVCLKVWQCELYDLYHVNPLSCISPMHPTLLFHSV